MSLWTVQFSKWISRPSGSNFLTYWGISTSEPKFGYLYPIFPYVYIEETDEVIPPVVHFSNYLPDMTPVCLVLRRAMDVHRVTQCAKVCANVFNTFIYTYCYLQWINMIQTKTFALVIAIGAIGIGIAAVQFPSAYADYSISGHQTSTCSVSGACSSSGHQEVGCTGTGTSTVCTSTSTGNRDADAIGGLSGGGHITTTIKFNTNPPTTTTTCKGSVC